MADEFNPFLNAGLLGMMGPNIYEDQKFVGKPLALPGFFTSGQSIPPTDAYGQPIQRYGDEMAGANTKYAQQMDQYNAQRAAMASAPPPAQGTTMTSVPPGAFSGLGQWGGAIGELENNYLKTPAGAAAASNPNAAMIKFLQSQDQNISSSPQGATGGFGSGNSGPLSGAQRNQLVDNSTLISQLQRAGAAAPAAPAGPTAPTPPDDRQAYLDALSSPGPLKKVGANVPASPPLGVPNVMTAFMAAHPSGGGKGAGNYDNSGFFNTLNQLGRTA